MKVLKNVVLAAMLMLGIVTGANAATVFVPSAGSVTASVLTDFSTFVFYDVRGAATGMVGSVPTLIADLTGGTDPAFATLPFGNSKLFAVDGVNTVQLDFSFTNPTVGTFLTFATTGTSVVNGNGLLSSLVGPLTADFAFSNSQVFGGATLLTYNLTSISTPVPEPAAFLLIGTTLPVIVLLRRRRNQPVS